MLGEQVERAIDDAWARVRREIIADPPELLRRLARRRLKSLTRPARAWCIAIRASDRRITPMHWIITPEHALDLHHPDHPYEPIEHTVTIQKHAIRRYCNPVSFSREQSVEVAKMLGVSDGHLWHARSQGRFAEDFYRGLGGKRGKPVPLLSPRGQLLDPSFARYYAAPHPAWGSSWEWLSHRFPNNFEQTITRRPVFRYFRGGCGTIMPHPISPSSHPQSSWRHRFLGWRWICPGCKKPVRTIYFPLPVRTMFDRWFIDPARRLHLGQFNFPQKPPPTFACRHCHNIQYFSSIAPSCWNQLVSYLSAGLLYGCEVPKPAAFIPHRLRPRRPQLTRPSPRRDRVLRRLLNGWSNKQIQHALQITKGALDSHLHSLFLQHNVPDRHALVAKLGGTTPPLNRDERAAQRRFQTQTLLLQGLSIKEMIKQLNTDYKTLMRDIGAIYRHHDIPPTKGPNNARRALAKKLGMELPPIGAELMRIKVQELRNQGLSIPQIAKELRRCEAVIRRHLKKVSSPTPVGAGTPRAVHDSLERLQS